MPVMQLTDVARLHYVVSDNAMEAGLYLHFNKKFSSASHHIAAAHVEPLYFHIWICLWPKTAWNDLFHSNPAVSESPDLSSVDCSDGSQTQKT